MRTIGANFTLLLKYMRQLAGNYVEAYGPVLYLSPSLLQLELEIRPVLFVEVIVNLLR